MTTADGQMVQHLVTAENQVSGLQDIRAGRPGGWGGGVVGPLQERGQNPTVSLPSPRSNTSSLRMGSSTYYLMSLWYCLKAITYR